MDYKRAFVVSGLTLAVIAASRRIEPTRDVFVPNVGDSLFSFLPWVD